MAIPVSVREGHPNNWPRKLARKHYIAFQAVEKLRDKLDDANQRFALVEFVEERERIERAMCADLVRGAGCVCRSLWIASRRARHSCGWNGDYRYEGDDFTVMRHDTCCPIFLADAVEKRKD